MNVSLEKLSDVTGKLIVNVVEDDYQKELTNQLKEIGRKREFPGFRKGHVPFSHIVRMFGKQVKSEVINQEVYKAVFEYIDANKLHILGEPLPVEVKEISMEQKDYTFEYEVGLAPEINVDLESVKIPFYNIKVDEKMVEDQDKELRTRFGAQVPGEEVIDNALVKGAIMELNPDGSIKETEDAIQVIDGIVAPSYFTDKDETAKFMGKKVGDKVVFNPAKTCNGNAAELGSMLHLDKDKAAGVTADFELAISEIIVVKDAELNEEFFKNVFADGSVTDEASYKEALRKMIANQLAPNSEMKFQVDARKDLVERFGNIELPAEFLKKWLVIRNEDLNASNIDEEYDKLVPEFKWELVKGAVEEKLDIKVEEADILSFAKGLAARQFAQYGMTNLGEDVFEDYAKRILANKDSRRQIASEVSNMKLFNAIKAKVQLDNQEVSLDQFKEIINK